jgi:fatty-acyl-CoA synthase
LPFARQALGETTLAHVLERQARVQGGRMALQYGERQVSFGELDARVNHAVRWLEARGVKGGDVVALVGSNSLGYVELLLAGARAGITLALVHPELSGPPLQHALTVAGARLALCEAELAPKLWALSFPCHEFELEQSYDQSEARRATTQRSQRNRPPARAPGGARIPQRDFALIYTSGTTGMPKACRIPHARVLAAACLFGAPLFDFVDGDKLLCALPLYHASPLLLGLATCLIGGAALVLERRFSARELLATARRTEATGLLYVGELGRMLLATPVSALDREHGLRFAVGNGMAEDCWRGIAQRFGIEDIREFYAATESPVGIFNLSGRIGSVGNLPFDWMFGLKLARLDPETGELMRDRHGYLLEAGVNEPGELLVKARTRGIGVYYGYLDRKATEARIVRAAFRPGDAYFRTGDVLRKDRDGYYYFVERAGESYRFRGENVSLAQVEGELRALPEVAQAVVTAVALPGYDGRLGLAGVVTRPGFRIEQLEQLQRRLPRSAWPRFVRQLPELELTGSLKLKRRALSDAGVDAAPSLQPMWVLEDDRYVELDAERYAAIRASSFRF